MANIEAASPATGPRYAPDDPNLPKPWKGLIDGSTGLIYYWNPETNITQYEKPASAPPPVPSAVPHVDTASQNTVQHGQPSDASQYQQQYMNQLSQQPGQFQGPISQQQGHYQGPQTASNPQQQPAQIPPSGQQQYVHYGQGMPQRSSQIGLAPVQQGQPTQPQHYGPPMTQQSGQQLLPHQGSQMVQNPIQHNSQQLGQQAPLHQGPTAAQSQGLHYMPHQMQYAPYQQPPMHPQGQQNVQLHPQVTPQGPQFSYQQDNRNAQQDDSDYPKKTGSTISQVEQSGHTAGHGPPSMNTSNHGLQGSPLSGQSQPYASSVHMHQPHPNVKVPETRSDIAHQPHPSTFQNQMGQSFMQGQQHGLPPVGRNMGYDESQQLRSGKGYDFNASKDSQLVLPLHPNLAAVPMPRNQQVPFISANVFLTLAGAFIMFFLY